MSISFHHFSLDQSPIENSYQISSTPYTACIFSSYSYRTSCERVFRCTAIFSNRRLTAVSSTEFGKQSLLEMSGPPPQNFCRKYQTSGDIFLKIPSFKSLSQSADWFLISDGLGCPNMRQPFLLSSQTNFFHCSSQFLFMSTFVFLLESLSAKEAISFSDVLISLIMFNRCRHSLHSSFSWVIVTRLPPNVSNWHSLRTVPTSAKSEVSLKFAVTADKGIHERRDLKIEFEIETPEIRERNDGIYVNLEATSNISIKRVVLWVGLPFVYCQLYAFVRPFSLRYDFIAKGKLFFCFFVPHMGHKSLVFAVNATNVLVNAFLFRWCFVFDKLFCKFMEVDLIRQQYVDTINVFSKLYDQVVGQIYVGEVLVDLFRALFADKFALFYFFYYQVVIVTPVECLLDQIQELGLKIVVLVLGFLVAHLQAFEFVAVYHGMVAVSTVFLQNTLASKVFPQK